MPLATGNAEIVKRSNALLNYGKQVTYKESAVNAGFMAAFVTYFGLVLLGTCLLSRPLRWIL